MLVLADLKVRPCIDGAAAEITSLDEWHSLGIMVTGIHDANSNPTIFSEEVAKRNNVPIVGKFFNARICKMGASCFLKITWHNPVPSN